MSYRLDYLINGTSCIAPFSKEECENLLKVLDSLRDGFYENSAGTTTFLAWVLKSIYSGWLKLTRRQHTEFRDSQSRTNIGHTQPPEFVRILLSLIIKFPFFGIPETYLAHTKDASEFRGRLVDLQERWEAYTRQLIREYSDFILAATVLMSATMGFLAVPDLEQVAKALGIIPVFAALSSIIIGVFFVWRHHRPPPSKNSMAYIHNARNNPLGLPGHAVLLSLPPVFLVWSIISFAAGVVAYTVQHANAQSASIWTVVSFFAVFCLLLLVGLFTFSRIWVWKK
ncbi:unnamed protein product [Somion occarium]|uniref:Uncharacterized protein n=1 Tax=Somion occarium TaxID=3059160 RepID=A0ABP1D0L3_9APHY